MRFESMKQKSPPRPSRAGKLGRVRATWAGCKPARRPHAWWTRQ